MLSFNGAVHVDIASILPRYNKLGFSIDKVAPAIEYAIKRLKENNTVPKLNITVSYEDSKCFSAESVNHAFNFYMKRKVHVFFGPVCDFAAAPVARQITYWKTPMLSAGANAMDFAVNKKRDYPYLTRVGAHFGDMVEFITSLFSDFNWFNYQLIYEDDPDKNRENKCESKVDYFKMCYFAGEALVQYTPKKATLKHEKLKSSSELKEQLTDTIGANVGVFSVFFIILDVTVVISDKSHHMDHFGRKLQGTVNVAAILPAQSARLFSRQRVSQALAIAVNASSAYLGKINMVVYHGDSLCDIAEGMHQAFELHLRGEADVFLGPACDFAAAPVARQAKFWDTPVISAGAFAMEFKQKRTGMYPTLTRVGDNVHSLTYFIHRLIRQFGWRNFRLIYEKEGQDNIITSFCHVVSEGLIYISSKEDSEPVEYKRIKDGLDGILQEFLGIDNGGRFIAIALLVG
ncbi:atrial natriuretic peptide receptor 1-like [Lingula anatina]|uniref:Atrial natriuretic peptide receptor 1-like n=1 Tax=Lingula anatina TaxID=7574 RepID=A0A1S3IQN2_LINAN|nr:atrial natriuretic peptide receptor 1-like [Lingula anatina]|eukprot:XP_013400522.1 atrial natriuretic peptide receptor 1-like [Lingula anatina]